jgi:hypothetical protein
MQEFVSEHKPINTEKESTRLAKLFDAEDWDFTAKPIKELSQTLMHANQKEFNEILTKTAAKDVKTQGADLDLGKWNPEKKNWDWNEQLQGKGFDRVLASESPEGYFWRIVLKGDTLSKIVQEESKYLTPDEKAKFGPDLIKLNKITNPDFLVPGQALKLPQYDG